MLNSNEDWHNGSPQNSRPRFRPDPYVRYTPIFRSWDVIFMPSYGYNDDSLPTFTFRPSESISSLVPQLKTSKNFPCFVQKNCNKEDFVIVIKALHFRLQAIQSYVQKRIISTILLDVIIKAKMPDLAKASSLSNSSVSLAPLIDLSDEALQQEHYSPLHLKEHEDISFLDVDLDEQPLEVEESAIKDEYNTFDFLNLMSSTGSSCSDTQNDSSSFEMSCRAKDILDSDSKSQYELSVPLTPELGSEINNNSLLIEFLVAGKHLGEKFISDSLKTSTLKFENSTWKVPIDQIINIFKEIIRIIDSDFVKIKVDLYYKDTWKVLNIYLPSFGFPLCTFATLKDVQIMKKVAQFRLVFEDETTDTIWVNNNDGIDVVSSNGLNTVEVWPSYYKKYGKWPSKIGLKRGSLGMWKSLYFPMTEPHSKNKLRDNVSQLFKSNGSKISCVDDYVQALRVAGGSKDRVDTSLLPVLSEFSSFYKYTSCCP
ncbi:unnamed protein product [Lepeophtheirus salmonis]|uniref:(salmon louse) hypothetical protein n=1 Tax=Lepeophtheirus salmonis TaxID=72036 RepID=A0A7R8D6K1_LEPSM|nr:unnamed protein product [Lepeophtheirus salmonis]CAF3044842.1 unnamed protein product [Lepeophtheirus salmonis]